MDQWIGSPLAPFDRNEHHIHSRDGCFCFSLPRELCTFRSALGTALLMGHVEKMTPHPLSALAFEHWAVCVVQDLCVVLVFPQRDGSRTSPCVLNLTSEYNLGRVSMHDCA